MSSEPEFAPLADLALEQVESAADVASTLERLASLLDRVLSELEAVRRQRRLPVRLVSAEPSSALAGISRRQDEVDRTIVRSRAAWRALNRRIVALEARLGEMGRC
jgi:hypothetical protein